MAGYIFSPDSLDRLYTRTGVYGTKPLELVRHVFHAISNRITFTVLG